MVMKTMTKTYIGTEAKRGTHSGPDDLSWFKSIHGRSEMAVERLHKEYNRSTNYGRDPSMTKFATTFSRMEQIRRDKFIRYNEILTNGGTPKSTVSESMRITKKIVHWRDWFVQNTFDDREYAKATATKYLRMVYWVSYEHKVIDEWKNTGRYGLNWL